MTPRLISAVFIILLSCCCTHVKSAYPRIEKSMTSENETAAFCSELGVNGHRLKLTIETKNTQMPELAVNKTIELPYIHRGKSFSPSSISRDLILWRDDVVILTEVIPTETIDIFYVYVTSFVRKKDMSTYTSNVFLVLRLCQDAELSIGSTQGHLSLKAKLELLGSSIPN
jgi:hypothetical protein